MHNRINILIDRIDCCRRDPNDPKGKKLVKRLSNLLKSHRGKERIIITSADTPPPQLDPDLRVSVCMISIRNRPPSRRQRIRFNVTIFTHNGHEVMSQTFNAKATPLFKYHWKDRARRYGYILRVQKVATFALR
jgi:hypothetical protein